MRGSCSKSALGHIVALIFLGLNAFLLVASVHAVVLHSRDEALSMAFPNADEVRPLDFYLTPEQRSEIEQHARAKLESNLLTVYAGFQKSVPVGYALLDTHVVRTLPETLLIVLSAEGTVSAVHLLAFYEPPEYAPPEDWLKKFVGANAEQLAGPGVKAIDAIAGSTLTSRAVMQAVARAVAIHSVLLKGRQ
ncbi:MAG: FMN-binding protein [Candidatus Binatia bacterium]|nr:FMN-binding protein [Candidatus Binatia bacterium]